MATSTVTLNYPETEDAGVEALARKYRCTKTAILRKAIRLAITIDKREDAGDQILLVDSKGNRTMVLSLGGI